MTEKIKIAVIGGGAAGLFAACRAASPFCEITLYEKNPSLGRKLSITGKGRCNLTNNTTIDKVIENIPTNPKFLYTALNRFSPADTMDFFEELGVPLKTERGGRVFPVSDRAGDIVAALSECLHRCGTNIVHKRVESLIIRDGVACGLIAEKQEYDYDRIIVCTGGRSYPRTGSTGDGYRFAKDAGISVTACSPSLVPIETEDAWCRSVAGLSLKNVSLHIIDKTTGKSIYRDFGEMLFTHFGVSGPMILSASSHLRSMESGRYQAVIDLKPALDEIRLDERILHDFKIYSNKIFANALYDLLPRSLIPIVIHLTGISPDKKVNLISREERKKLIRTLKGLPLTLKKFRPLDEAIITSGGVSVKELNPKTMEAKKIKHLYFAGEVIDVDAYTGGFNLQIAFSTAALAAEAVKERNKL